MQAHVDKSPAPKAIHQSKPRAPKPEGSGQAYFVDLREKTAQFQSMQELADSYSEGNPTMQLQKMADGYLGRPNPVIQPKNNNTGLPDSLKTGIETLSGYPMDDVKVHYNSEKPAQLNAHAYAQGTHIHIASGQEKHLPHEAWHVVQQKQGRVKPTSQLQSGIKVNNEDSLEKEADTMGMKSLNTPINEATSGDFDVQKKIGSEHSDISHNPKMYQMAFVASGTIESNKGVIQTFPPNSLEEATNTIEQLKSALFEKGVIILIPQDGWNSEESLDDMDLDKMLNDHPDFAVSLTGGTGMSENAVREAIIEYIQTRRWRSGQHGRTFGYQAVDSFHFSPPSPFQNSFSFNPFAPQLHNVPFNQVPSGMTLEMIGQDMFVRNIPQQQLDELRSGSGAYRKPAQNTKPPDKPQFGELVYNDQSTMLDQSRVNEWSVEKRDGKRPALHGPNKGSPWQKQQQVMGCSAQEALEAAQREGITGLVGGAYDWLHLFSFSIGGMDNSNPQVAANLIVGTQNANFYHLMFESIAKELAKQYGHQVQVRISVLHPISPKWHIYGTLRYSFAVMEQIQVSPMHSPMVRPRSVVVRDIACLHKQQVHAGDQEILRHSILAELGIQTPEYREAVETVFPTALHDKPLLGPKQLPEFMHLKKEVEMINLLLHENNCLINAVAHGLEGRKATFEELVTIRGIMIERGIPLGHMLVASPQVLDIIRQTFFSNRGIRVVYRGTNDPDDVIDGDNPIIIDHEYLHFEYRRPGNSNK